MGKQGAIVKDRLNGKGRTCCVDGELMAEKRQDPHFFSPPCFLSRTKTCSQGRGK